MSHCLTCFTFPLALAACFCLCFVAVLCVGLVFVLCFSSCFLMDCLYPRDLPQPARGKKKGVFLRVLQVLGDVLIFTREF